MQKLGLICLLAIPLIAAGAKPKLHELVVYGDAEAVAAAIEPRKIDKLDRKDNAAIHYAAAAARAEIVEILIAHGADVNVLNKKYRTTPLHDLARTVSKDRKGIRNTATLLLENGANPNLIDGHGESVLHAASRVGNAVALRVVLRSDAFNANGSDVEKALSIAREYGRFEVIKLLETHGAESLAGREVGLLNAARLGDYAMVDNLIAAGADIETRSENGETPLLLAARHGHTELVSQLIQNSADVNARAQNGATPLHLAARHGHLETIKLLLNNNASINASAESFGTPINSAAEKEQIDIVDFLLSQGGVPGTVTASADNAFGSGLGWLLYAEYHESSAPETETGQRKTHAKEMFGMAKPMFEEQRSLHEDMRRKEKRTEAILNATATVIAAAAVVGLEHLQQEQAAANRRQTAQIMALSDATSYDDYHARYRLYSQAMIQPTTRTPFQVDITNTSIANKESISGLDVIITEYERRIALTDKLSKGLR